MAMMTAELDAFAERRSELAANVARLEARRAELDTELTDAIGSQLFDGRSTSRKQDALKRDIATLDDELAPSRHALDQAEQLFARAQVSAARRQHDSATVIRAELRSDYGAALDEYATAVEALVAANRRLRDLADQDRAA